LTGERKRELKKNKKTGFKEKMRMKKKPKTGQRKKKKKKGPKTGKKKKEKNDAQQKRQPYHFYSTSHVLMFSCSHVAHW
jgi:hypothetical protein